MSDKKKRSMAGLPWIAAMASVKRELGGKWAFIMVANQCIVAWLAAFGTRLIMML